MSGSTEANKALVLSFVQQLCNDHNFDGGDRFLNPDFTSHRHTGTTVGREKWLGFFQKVVQEKMPNLQMEVTRIIAEGDFVWTYGVIRGAFGLKPGFKRDSVDIYQFKHGKIDAHWDVQQDVEDNAAHTSA